MKVRALVTLSAPQGKTFAPGEIADLKDGQDLIDRGFAEPATESKPPKVETGPKVSEATGE